MAARSASLLSRISCVRSGTVIGENERRPPVPSPRELQESVVSASPAVNRNSDDSSRLSVARWHRLSTPRRSRDHHGGIVTMNGERYGHDQPNRDDGWRAAHRLLQTVRPVSVRLTSRGGSVKISVALVNMPFAAARRPSLALTPLRAATRSALGDDVPVKVAYANHLLAAELGSLYVELRPKSATRTSSSSWAAPTANLPWVSRS